MRADPTAINIDFDPRSKRMIGVARHGNTHFDVPFISRVHDQLWQGGCANGLVLPDIITDVVSLYPWEKYAHRHEVRSATYVKMYDAEVTPDRDEVEGIADWIISRQNKGGVVLVHCQAGLNRSGLVAAVSLMRSGEVESGDEAIGRLRSCRSDAVLCNKVFRDWVSGYREAADE